MPIYEYQCESCGKVFEKMESINSENKAQPCVSCGAEAKRKISASSFQLKGGGWYSSGYSSSTGGACSTSNPACASCPAAKAD